MAVVNAYLTFNGNTEEVFEFYRSVFGGDFYVFQRFGDTPHGAQMSDADKQKIMHVSLKVGTSVIMASDVLESMGQKVDQGDAWSLSVAADSEAEADKIFAGLSTGGKVTMPLQKTFWNAYFGMTLDQFGIKWLVNYDYPKEQ